MNCPYCNFPDTRVMDKRESGEGAVTRRRRECLSCGKRFTTYERAESLSLIVIKKDGRREQYDREKIFRGIVKACEKRPVSAEAIEGIVNDIDLHIRRRDKVEISSSKIGRMVMGRLKKVDKVAYIRFASVYKDFKDTDEFQKELRKLHDGR